MRETADTAAGLVGGRYEIVRPLASGGMATVYIARHHLTRQEVALKVVASVFARDQTGVARFLREVSVASRILHEGVVKVFDAGFDEALGSPYLAMELLEGGSLAEMLSARKVDQEGALRLVLAFLDPLAAAHDAGVVHRDLKPENVFVTRDGQVKLLDFGVARDLRGSRATMEGTALGTVYYMAPEQAVDARSVGAAADVYAVGVTLYQILCGIFPFDGTTPHAVLIRANRETAVPTATRAPWAHPNLCELVDRCLAKSPDDRPADAASLRGLLAALLDDAEVVASLQGRGVNPATFLSTPPPPSLSGDFQDPFVAAATTPPPAPTPTPRGTVVAAIAPAPAIDSVSEPVTEPVTEPEPVTAPQRRWWWLAAAIPAVMLAALLVRVVSRPNGAPPTALPPPTELPAPVVPSPAPAPAPPVALPVARPTPGPTLAQAPEPARVDDPRSAPARAARTRPSTPELIVAPVAAVAEPTPAPSPTPPSQPPAPTPAPPEPPPPVVAAAPTPAVVAPSATPPPPRPVAAPTPTPPPTTPSSESPPFVTF